jgi:hypothetical protein
MISVGKCGAEHKYPEEKLNLEYGLKGSRGMGGEAYRGPSLRSG